MTPQEIFSKIDHTLLSVTATQEEFIALAEEGIEAGAASLCVTPAAIPFLKEKYGDAIPLTTVIGFPNGYQTTETKVFETLDAISKGAVEVDMVIAVGKAKEKDYDYLLHEISAVRAAAKGKVLKVIIETCLLTEEEKIMLCEIVTKAGADYIKTSTGFSKAGATIEDVLLFKKHIGKNVKIKAAGGIRTLEDAEKFIAAGADRIGASAVIKGYYKR
ncbi:MAG TPA: deoxyribose-phosphate aldolase [Clostridiales bacterium]|nr:deoxyribose-phosphate aldolase [Clostridiales bacterium]